MKKKKIDVFVAIGSSAGGFEALSNFVTYLPQKTGFFYFLAQHHSLGEKPILANLLNRNSKIEVVLVQLGMLFKPDILYVLPPELKIIIKNNKPTALKADLDLHVPLPNADLLFSELSTLKNSKTIALLLSGTGHDGTLGMKIVKESDGITMVQSLEEAIFDAMPKSAIDARHVDYVLDVQEIAKKLEKLSSAFANDTYSTQEIPFDTIVKILHKEKQLDLFKYKEETINRRIQKRMELLHFSTIQEYANYFEANTQEVDILNQEVLIGVTEFFRGTGAFESLKTQIKQKLFHMPEHSELRLWCVACSSGEEAYSLGILVNEICQELNKKFYIKIFASDIDDIALEKARIGEYKINALEHISSEFVEKYFVKTDYGVKVVKSLREQIVFAHHNFLNNPPFINIDIISCRNVLIYLKSSVQSDVFSTFYYALSSDGLLFLGSSESTLSSLELFATLDNKNRIYQKKEQNKEAKFQMQVLGKYKNNPSKRGEESMQKLINPQEIEKHLQEELFDYFSNGSLIIDCNYTILYKKGNIPYLNFADGILSLNLFDNLDRALQYDLKVLIKQVLLSNMKEMSKFIQLKSSPDEKFVQMIVQPFHMPTQKSMLLITFLEIESKDLLVNCLSLPSFNENTMISTLTCQVSKARNEIENISEELVFSKQNMAMMNGELQDSNEKLQSTVEELETSNEELQSSNEELIASLASNRELQNKLSLILESSMDGVLGLDIHARHIFANERAAQMLGYSPEYLIGKDSHRMWHHTKPDGSNYPEDECLIARTLVEGKEFRGEDLFWHKDGTSFPVEFMRSPIIENGEITGAVVSFHDISEKKALAQKNKSEIEKVTFKYKQTFQVAQVGIAHVGLDGTWLDANAYLCNLLGYTKEELLKLTFQDITHAEDVEKDLAYATQLLEGSIPTYHIQKRYICKNGDIIWVNLSVVLLHDSENNPLYFISIIENISQIKMLMLELELKNNELENIIRRMHESEELMLAQSRQAAMGDMIAMIAHQWRQPLSIISMAGNNLRADLELELEITKPALYELVNVLNEQTQSLSHTIEDFRTFSKPEKAKEIVSLCAIYEKLRNMMEKTLENNQVSLHFVNDCEVKLSTYPNEFLQVFMNLLNNSKDAIKERNIRDGNIDITTTLAKDVLTIEVSDNAGGIDEKILSKLGEPYVSTKSKNGTGLGLYMSKMILEKHFGGTLSWKNSKGGSCFTITLSLGV
ncbi:MAG: PAS domain S-box protein [Campylobacterales bacterium]|nr:PAS domain S-box protein [Campylobacterales bacterium]